MKLTSTLPLAFAFLLSMTTTPVAAQSSSQGAGNPSPDYFEARAAAGFLYDSNVSLSELDQSSSQADQALLLDFGVGVNIPFGQHLKLSADYDFSRTQYQELSQFDLDLHQVVATLGYQDRFFDASISGNYFNAVLAGDGYLNLTQAGGSLGYLFRQTLYLRGAYTVSQKDFADYPQRDSDNTELRTDAYYLLDGMHRYVSLGYSAVNEDALGPEYDYQGAIARLAYGHKLVMGERPLKLKAQLRLEERDYDNITPSIGELRQDQRWGAGLSANLPLSTHLNLLGEVNYNDNQSNLASANYDETTFSLSLGANF